MRPVLALDIGGTKLAAAVVSADGSVRGRRVIDTQPEDGAERIIDRALDLAEAVRREEEASPPLTAFGVSTKGITREDGVLIAGMPGWSRLPDPGPAERAVPGYGDLGHERRKGRHHGRNDLGGAARDIPRPLLQPRDGA